jgi:nucleotide-binding universal stress UspA family protein
MYETIYVPVDNSDHSNAAVEISVALGKLYGSKLIGSHAYAGKLHDIRFKQMEFTLPDEYKDEQELEKQRKIHDTLIVRGLTLISDSYLDPVEKKCAAEGLAFERRLYDGRNFEVIVEDIRKGGYQLVVLGALGQGAVRGSTAGSVCERVLRRTSVDTLVVRDIASAALQGTGAIVVGMDGSAWSWGALMTACDLAERTGREIDLCVVQDGDPVCEELLDAHARLARRLVRDRRARMRLTVLEGRPEEALRGHLERSQAWLCVVGRQGIDSGVAAPGLGSVTTSLVRTAPCNVWVSARLFEPFPPANVTVPAAA